ncbi:tRNA (N6-threonylcarbamoyladenosine(37)-N6)-methyltransferase TrmO [Salinimonas chungwhensis]|uniref:tRNA (N6-threonylcarbamoyladenosine(37)-N6)-methyltransferase TrmO n=1 Tax=Salinimonas chungwhensis TaxID=265425 RepID=UPI00037118A2|nr:tRNA (N6-threonylcarbamoyladenosine(37)-N6)-methyltransferase TrmO [Salinimonas chungwhensis]
MKTGYPLSAIATITTPYKQKFAIPRQPNLAEANGQIHFIDGFDNPLMLKGLEKYSHLWLLFIFHETLDRGWKPAVKAPRLGGNSTLGVFASRSTHRPNGIGMSVVKNAGAAINNGHLQLNVSGVDLLDQTPIIDIKPYIGYADSHPDAIDGLAELAPIPSRQVNFTATAQAQLHQVSQRFADIEALIIAVLRQDPRPAYRQSQETDPKIYKVKLYDVDVAWRVINGEVQVLELL